MRATHIKNITWNILGMLIPMTVAFFFFPFILKRLGESRFGILSLIWTIIGYFGLFDFGLSRALIISISGKLNSNHDKEVGLVIWTATSFVALTSILCFLTLFFLAEDLTYGFLNIPPELAEETILSIKIMALSLPFVLLSVVSTGILEADKRFKIINFVRTVFNILSFLLMLGIMLFTDNLAAVTLTVAFARLLSCCVFIQKCCSLYPYLKQFQAPDLHVLSRLLSFGGWLAISNIIGPLLLASGKFFIAAYLPIAFLAYYTTPFEILSKLIVVPSSFAKVIFVDFAQYINSNRNEMQSLYYKGLLYLSIIMIPLTIVIFYWSKTGLSLWLGPAFAEKSYRVAQIMAAGVLVNSYGHVSQAVIQGYGRSDLTAKLHFVEFVFYLPYLSYFVINWGVEGAAFAWLLRVFISTTALLLIARMCFDSKIMHKRYN